MGNIYPPLAEKELPKAPSLLKAFGVGAVVLGLAIGSGELILWPHLVTKFGFGILWGALLGIIMQYFINQEVARNALATGESFFTAASRVLEWAVPFWIVSTVFLYIWPGWAGAIGSTLSALFNFGSTNAWAWASLALVIIFVFSGRVAYNVMELVVKIVILIFFTMISVVSFVNLTPEIIVEAFRGLFNFGWLPDNIDTAVFLGAVVFAGAGGLLNVAISFWYRDKQAGMGAYVERIQNPITSRPEAIAATGYTFTPTAENLLRWRGWMRIVYFDQGIIFGLSSLVSLLLLALNAYAVLAPLGIAPDGINILNEQARIFGNLWGKTGSTIFLAVVFLQLFATLWVVLDAFTRIMGDIVYTNAQVGPFKKYFFWAKRFSAHTIYYILFISLIIINAVLIPFGQPFVFLVISAVLGGTVMAIYTPILLYVNNFKLQKAIRPSLITNFVLVVTSAFYAYFSVKILFSLI